MKGIFGCLAKEKSSYLSVLSSSENSELAPNDRVCSSVTLIACRLTPSEFSAKKQGKIYITRIRKKPSSSSKIKASDALCYRLKECPMQSCSYYVGDGTLSSSNSNTTRPAFPFIYLLPES